MLIWNGSQNWSKNKLVKLYRTSARVDLVQRPLTGAQYTECIWGCLSTPHSWDVVFPACPSCLCVSVWVHWSSVRRVGGPGTSACTVAGPGPSRTTAVSTSSAAKYSKITIVKNTRKWLSSQNYVYIFLEIFTNILRPWDLYKFLGFLLILPHSLKDI